MLEIDIDKLLSAQAANDDGFTTAEWAEQLGLSEERMRKVLAKGVPLGAFSVGKQIRKHYTGRSYSFIVYKWVGGN